MGVVAPGEKKGICNVRFQSSMLPYFHTCLIDGRGLGVAALLVGRSRDRLPVVSVDFFRPFHGPGVDSIPSENVYQEHFLGVKVAGA